MIFGPKLAHGGCAETVEALVNHPAYKTPLGLNQGRGVASGYWFNGGGESSASVQVNEDGTVHRRLTELPMSPPKIRAALDAGQADD